MITSAALLKLLPYMLALKAAGGMIDILVHWVKTRINNKAANENVSKQNH